MNIKAKPFPAVVSYMSLVGLRVNEFSFPKTGRTNIDFIEQVVCSFFKVTIEDIHSKMRDDKYVKPRHIAMFLIRKYSNLTLEEVAERYGNRNHASVIRGVRSVKGQLDVDEFYRKQFIHIESMIL